MLFTKNTILRVYDYCTLRTTYYYFYHHIILTKVVLGGPETRPPQFFRYKTEQNKYI
jgi:hypothetical protein